MDYLSAMILVSPVSSVFHGVGKHLLSGESVTAALSEGQPNKKCIQIKLVALNGYFFNVLKRWSYES